MRVFAKKGASGAGQGRGGLWVKVPAGKSPRRAEGLSPWAIAPVPRPPGGAGGALAVSRASDATEREADTLAARVLGRRSGETPRHGGAETAPVVAPDADAAVKALPGGGQPLGAGERQFFERGFGAGLGHVRVHEGPGAGQLADRLSAQALAFGPHVVLGSEHRGREARASLLAHEIAHTLQHQRAPGGAPRVHRKPKDSAAAPATGAASAPAAQKISVVFDDTASRWLVSVGGIAVAEVAVKDKQTFVQLTVDMTGTDVTVTVRHFGDVSLAAAPASNVSPAFSVTFKEIDLRSSGGDDEERRRDPAAPPVPGASATGTVDLVIGPASMIRRPATARPEAGDGGPIELTPRPGALTDFEERLAAEPGLVRGVVLDPDDRSQIIGYSVTATTGLTRVVDREGNEVFLHEVGIESPAVDPIDFVPTPGSVAKAGAGIAGKLGVKKLFAKSAAGAIKIPVSVIARLRAVAKAVTGRVIRTGVRRAADFVQRITLEGLNHSFDSHAAQWFGRAVARDTHFQLWRALIEHVAESKQVFAWSTGPFPTIAHLARVEGKYFVVQFFEETGELATAFVPSSSQLTQMLRILAATK